MPHKYCNIVYKNLIVGVNDGETCIGNTEPFSCDICYKDSMRMFELGGIQVCKRCFGMALKETLKEIKIDKRLKI